MLNALQLWAASDHAFYRTISYSSSRCCTHIKEGPGVAVKLIEATIGPLV